MNWYRPAMFIVMFAIAVPVVAVQPPQRNVVGRRQDGSSALRWVRQLQNEIDHLQEDLYYERGSYPAGLRERVEQASRAVAHFHGVLRQSPDREHLMRDFEEMDRQVHQLVDQLSRSGDSWLRRQASRIRYPDEQLHYVLRTRSPDGGSAPREVLARHAHVLENEARNLRQLVERSGRRDEGVRDAVRAFADEAEHFHQVVEQGADAEHLRRDFRDVDEDWHRVTAQLNRSDHGFYVRRRAQDINRVHNQIHGILETRHEPGAEVPDDRRRAERPRRPSIEFEIPGIGRFRIPR